MGRCAGGLLKSYRYLHEVLILRLMRSSNNHLVPVAGDFHVAGAVEKDHGARMFVNRSLVGNLFDVDIEDAAHGKVNGLGVHEIALKEELDPTSILRNPQDQTGGVSHLFDEFFPAV